jgi:hypothetical protein
MISIPKNLIKEVMDGEKAPEVLEMYLINNYSLNEVLKFCVDMILNDSNQKPQISITEEEYNYITSLFKVKGQRLINGEVVTERRGRPRKEEKLKR